MTARKNKPAQRRWLRAYFICGALASLLALALVFIAASEADSAVLLGLSATRLALAVGLVALGIFFSWAAWVGTEKLEKRVLGAISVPVPYAAAIAIAILAVLLSFYLIILTFKFTDALVAARLTRLLPVFVWLFVMAAATLVVAPRLRFGRSFPLDSATLGVAGIAALCFLAIGFLVTLTGLGLTPDRAGWDSPGVPLLTTQVAGALAGAFLLFGVLIYLQRRFKWEFSRLDLAAAVLLWLLAVGLWQSQPMSPIFYAPTPRAPNFEYYPSSDAATVDIAGQRLLVGEGFTEIAEKPLYSFFLAGLHTVAGQSYASVVFVQTLVLALFPAVLYLIATRLHHRLAGLLLSVLVILREVNGIALSGQISVSHSKLLMTDLPTALGMAAFTLLLIRWLENKNRPILWPLWVGAGLGALTLLRSQVILFLPILALVAFLYAAKNLRHRVVNAGFVVLGFALITLPWVARNYQYTGQFGYSQPLQAQYVAGQYSLTPELSGSEQSSLGFSQVIQFTLAHPLEVTRFVSAHFLHNEVSSLLALPASFDLPDKLVTYYNYLPYWQGAEDRLWNECCGLETYISQAPYWDRWDGVVPGGASMPFAFNLLVVAVGIGAVWKRVGWLTMVPIGVHLLYSLSTSVARVSGWRLILPVDWVLLLFYCAGLAQLGLWIWSYLFGKNPALQQSKPNNRKQETQTLQGVPVWVAGLLVAGLLLPISEMIVPDRYTQDSTEVSQAWEEVGLAEETGVDMQTFLAQPNAALRIGRALYPRYYAANEGEPGGDSAFHDQPFARMAFWVVGPVTDRVALPLLTVPVGFPNAVDVYVIGCEGGAFFRAAAVIFPNGDAPNLVASAEDAFVCTP